MTKIRKREKKIVGTRGYDVDLIGDAAHGILHGFDWTKTHKPGAYWAGVYEELKTLLSAAR